MREETGVTALSSATGGGVMAAATAGGELESESRTDGGLSSGDCGIGSAACGLESASILTVIKYH